MEKFVYTVAFAQVLLCLTALFIRRNQSGGGIFLCLVGVVLFRTGLELAIHSESSGYKGVTLGLLMASALWLSPIVVYLSNPTLKNSVRFKGSVLYPWLAPFIGFLCVIPLMLTGHSGSDYQSFLTPLSAEQWTQINALQFVAVGIFAVQAPVSVYFAWQQIRKSSKQPNPLFSLTLQPREHLTRVAILMVSATWFAALLRVCHCAVIGGPSNLSLVFSVLEVLLLMFGIVWVLIHASEKPFEKIEQEKYVRSALDNTVENRIDKKLSELKSDETWISQPSLGLKELCHRINENSHYVSQVLNQHYDGGFFEWLHRARIEYACRLLVAEPDIAIKEVTDACGFSAKSTFNTAFKRYQGCTPSAFRQQKTFAPTVPNL